MQFILATLNVAYVLTKPYPEEYENKTLAKSRECLKFRNEDFICRGHILNAMSDPIFDVYQNYLTARDLWNALEERYFTKDATRLKFIVSKFNFYKMVDLRLIMDQMYELEHILRNNDDSSLNHQQVEPRRITHQRRQRTFGTDFEMYLVGGDREGLIREYTIIYNLDEDPQAYSEAMKSHNSSFCKEDVNDEMDFIIRNNTWILIDLPHGSKSIKSKWIFERKLRFDGSIKKFKAWLVAKGFKQREGLDYFDTYAPVTRTTTIRILIALASINKLIIHQMDVKTAFLNGEALLIACYILNRVPRKRIIKTPYELWNKRTPKLYYFGYGHAGPLDDRFEENRFKTILKAHEISKEIVSIKIPIITVGNNGDSFPDHQYVEPRRSTCQQRQRTFGLDFEMYLVEGDRKGNNTWILIDLPPGSKAIKSKWIFKIKLRVDGRIEKFKAWFIAKGFTQREGLDYFDTYPPVARTTTIRILIALAFINKLVIHQMDVKTAFLNGELEYEVYIEQPEGSKLTYNTGRILAQNKYAKVIGSLIGDRSALEGYTDASWITDQEDYASTSRWIFTLGEGVVS
nr:zinc finger, CCHC-type [Tanacetum cinerariifolium]